MRLRRVSVLLGVAGYAAVVAVTGAGAAFPGSNGRIVFSSNRDGNWEIYSTNADGTGRVDLTRSPAADMMPRFSPDGSRIAFASNRDGGPPEIYAMNADGSGQTRLTNASGTSDRPDWIAGGAAIVFEANRDRNLEIYRMNSDGSHPTNLTRNRAADTDPAASPDGSRIAFTSTRGRGSHLYVINTSGRQLRRITRGQGHDSEPSWSPEGRRLVFVRSSGAGSDLYLVAVSGTGLTRLTATAGVKETSPAFSADGQQIAFDACSPGGGCTIDVINADGSGVVDISTPRAPYLDSFDDTRIDPFWQTPVVGTGPVVAETNGLLQFTVPASTTNDPSRGFAAADADSACMLHGDFDIQIDFLLIQWGGPSYVNLSFSPLGTPGLFVHDPGSGETISTTSGPNAFVSYGSASGQLRLVREGSSLTASYNDGGANWVPLITDPVTTTDLHLQLQAFTNAPPNSHGDRVVALDNFRLNSGNLACPSSWNDTTPNWQPLHG